MTIDLPRDGWFVTDDRLIYQLVNGSAYLTDETQLDKAVLDLAPGYYDQKHVASKGVAHA